MQRSESITKIAAAIVKMQLEIKHAKKDSDNPFFKSKYADLQSVWEADHEALQANRLAIVQLHVPAPEGYVGLETVLIHESGEWISGTGQAKIVKDDPQAYGSGTTYLRRQGRAAITGLITEDDDANAASGNTSKGPAGRTSPLPAPKAPATPKAPAGPTRVGDLSVIPMTAIEGVTQAKMLSGQMQYTIHAGEKYYTTDIKLAANTKIIADGSKFCTLSYYELSDNTREVVTITVNP